MNDYTVERTDTSAIQIRFNNVASGWEQWIMLTGDRHHDNVRCNRELEYKQLEKAKEREALIIDVGDLFCAMQGKYDPRKSYDEMREEYLAEKYLDEIVSGAANDYKDYAHLWLLQAKGNHELAVLKRMNTDLIERWAALINTVYNGNVSVGGIGGWVKFSFVINGTKQISKNLKWHHGAGGGGPVTRGVIQTNRQAVYLPNADIVVNGHTHDGWVVPIARETINNRGKVGRNIIWFVRTPTYKDDYGDGSDGYHNVRWGPPKPMGCMWLHFFAGNTQNGEICIDISQDME